MENQITVKEMLTTMESGLPFSMTYITYDSRRKKGGKVAEVLEARLLGADDDRPERPLTRYEQTMDQLNRIQQGRDPRHMKWYTRNIVLLQQGRRTSIVQKIHPPLVILFNNKIVVA